MWTDPETPNRERKRLLAHIIEDVTLLKLPKRGATKAHIRFKGGKTQTLVTMSPKSPSQQVKTNPDIIELIDKSSTIIFFPRSPTFSTITYIVRAR